MSDIDQKNQNVQNQIIAENLGNLLIGDNNTVISSLSDAYKPYLIGLIDELGKEPYVPLSGYTTELPEQYKDLAHGQGEIIENYKNLFDILKKYSQFVLLGDPGTGKSQVLKFMALQVAKKCLESDFKSPLPLLIDLSLWEKESSFEDFIMSYWGELKISGNPIQLITQGAIFLFLDGLNEMGENGSQNVIEINKWLSSSKHHNKKIFVGCRKSDYLNREENLKIANFVKVFITPLTDEQIVEFAHAYLETPQQFLIQYTRKNLNDFLRLPYILSRLAILHGISKKTIENLGSLNHILVKSLWMREAEKKTLKNVDNGDENENIVFSMLSQLALLMYINGNSLSFDTNQAVYVFSKVLAKADGQDESETPEKHHISVAKRILEDSIQLGLLVTDNNKAKFSHQLIFEYFIARMFWSMNKMGADLPFEDVAYDENAALRYFDFGNIHYSDSVLKSIFIQLFGIFAETSAGELDIFLYNILKKSNNPVLAIDCISNTGIAIPPVFHRIITYELIQQFIFLFYGQPNDKGPNFDINTLRSGFKSGTIQFGIFLPSVKDFSVYLSKIFDDSCFELLTSLVGEDIWIDQGVMLGLVMSGEKGQDFFVDFLNDEANDYGVKSRIARCILEFPAEKKYVRTLKSLITNNLHAFGKKGAAGGRFTVGQLAIQKLQEIELITN